MKKSTKIHFLLIIALLSLFIVFIAYRLWILSEGNTTLSSQDIVKKSTTIIEKIESNNPATGIGILKSGIHGLCMYYNTKGKAELIMCDYNNSKIYTYSELTPGVWKEGTTLIVATLSRKPTGVCVSNDGMLLIVVSRGKSNVCLYKKENGVYGNPTVIESKIKWPVSPSMTPDGSKVIIPMQAGPYIYIGVRDGDKYKFKHLRIGGGLFGRLFNTKNKQRYFGSCINSDGTKIAYACSSNSKVYVSTINGSEISTTVEIEGNIPGEVRQVRFSEIDPNVLFVTNVASRDPGLRYSINNDGKWSKLRTIERTFPPFFDNTGFVIGDNNTVYISQFTGTGRPSDIYTFKYNVSYKKVTN